MKKLNFISLALGVAFVLFSVSVAFAGWEEPKCGPTGCNAEAPINVSLADQAKVGGLGIGGILHVYSGALIGGTMLNGKPNPNEKPVGVFNVIGSEGSGRGIQMDNREIKFRGDSVAHFSIFANRLPYKLTFDNSGNNTAMGGGSVVSNLMTIQNTGQVGIGTENPAGEYRLDVNGRVIADDVCIRKSDGTIKCLSGDTPPTPALQEPVTPGITQYRLTLAVNPSEAGTITGGASQSYDDGTSLTLTAVADSGWTFKNWNLNTATPSNNPLTVNMNKDNTVTANFTPTGGAVEMIDATGVTTVWPGKNLSSLSCPGGYVMTAIDSTTANARAFRGTCAKPSLNGTPLSVTTLIKGWSSGWRQDTAGGFDCPSGMAMTNIVSRKNGFFAIEWNVTCGQINNGTATLAAPTYVGPTLPTDTSKISCYPTYPNSAMTSIKAYYRGGLFSKWKIACSAISIP